MIPRQLAEDDVPAVMDLARSRGWAPIESELRLLLSQGRGYALDDGAPLAAVVTAIEHGPVCVLGTLLTRADRERQGLGTALMQHAMRQAAVSSFALLATGMGKPIYERLGFVPRGEVVQLQRTDAAPDSDREPSSVRAERATERDLARAVELDAAAHGWTRRAVLRACHDMSEEALAVRWGSGPDASFGYGARRPRGEGSLIGPVIATDEVAASAAIDALLAGAKPPVTVQIRGDHSATLAWCRNHGFQDSGRLAWMTAGTDISRRPGSAGWFSPISGALG